MKEFAVFKATIILDGRAKTIGSGWQVVQSRAVSARLADGKAERSEK
jgi:hypothetical protein